MSPPRKRSASTADAYWPPSGPAMSSCGCSSSARARWRCCCRCCQRRGAPSGTPRERSGTGTCRRRRGDRAWAPGRDSPKHTGLEVGPVLGCPCVNNRLRGSPTMLWGRCHTGEADCPVWTWRSSPRPRDHSRSSTLPGTSSLFFISQVQQMKEFRT